jgi:hypothetical protein
MCPNEAAFFTAKLSNRQFVRTSRYNSLSLAIVQEDGSRSFDRNLFDQNAIVPKRCLACFDRMEFDRLTNLSNFDLKKNIKICPFVKI